MRHGDVLIRVPSRQGWFFEGYLKKEDGYQKTIPVQTPSVFADSLTKMQAHVRGDANRWSKDHGSYLFLLSPGKTKLRPQGFCVAGRGESVSSDNNHGEGQ